MADAWYVPEASKLTLDFGFFSWPEPGVGSYVDVRRQTLAYETELGLSLNGSAVLSDSWTAKSRQLFWRGSPMVEVRQVRLLKTKLTFRTSCERAKINLGPTFASSTGEQLTRTKLVARRIMGISRRRRSTANMPSSPMLKAGRIAAD